MCFFFLNLLMYEHFVSGEVISCFSLVDVIFTAMSLRSPAQASCGPGGRKDTMMLVVLIEEESAG